MIVLDGATSHLTAKQCDTSPSDVISKLHEWMDTVQKNPEAICVDMTKRTTYTIPSRDGRTSVREFFLGARGPRFKKSGREHSPVQLMRKAVTVRNTQYSKEKKTLMELSMGRDGTEEGKHQSFQRRVESKLS